MAIQRKAGLLRLELNIHQLGLTSESLAQSQAHAHTHFHTAFWVDACKVVALKQHLSSLLLCSKTFSNKQKSLGGHDLDEPFSSFDFANATHVQAMKLGPWVGKLDLHDS